MSKLTYDRITLAAEQLDVAIDLYLTKSSVVSALTLAGAADGVLGSALKSEGKHNALEQEYENVMLTPWLYEISSQTYFKAKNHARNAAKHMDANEDRTLTANLKDEAMRMIVRAMTNYQQLGLPFTRSMDKFECWFYVNVVGITGMEC